MTSPSRPPKQPRPTISLPPLPDVRDEHGNRICAVSVGPTPGDPVRVIGLCGRPHRSTGRCERCYIREYMAERRRRDGRAPAVALGPTSRFNVTLPNAWRPMLDSSRKGRPVSEWLRDLVERALLGGPEAVTREPPPP